MNLLLKRTECGKVSTLGQLFVNGVFECFVLEDEDRQLEQEGTTKVAGKTCIPRGKYAVILTMSQRFQKVLPLLVEVPGFLGVRIHPGNHIEDTEGCLLPGTSFSTDADGKHTVNNSREAFRRLLTMIETAIDSQNEHVWITVD